MINILELPQAENVVTGVLKLVQRDGGWFPERFTARQFAYHAAVNDAQRIRTECAADVGLRFVTDSPWIELVFEHCGGARAFMGIDAEVDGSVLYTFRSETFEGTFQQRILDFGTEKPRYREIAIYLSAVTVTLLKTVGVAEGSRVGVAPRRPKRLLCLGDSITQGMSATSPLSIYTAQLARLLNADVLNQGIGGHVFDADSLDVTPGFEPDWITVAYGVNDWMEGLREAEVQAHASTYVARLQDVFPSASICVISPLWCHIADQIKEGGLDLAAFGKVIREAFGSTSGVHVVDGFSLVPHHGFYFVDGVHPNELGFMHYAVNLYRAVAEWDTAKFVGRGT